MFKVAIVGKPNVGKSTLFNRLIGKKQAIVLDQPGITRDRNYGICSWLNKDFELIDTGGFTIKKIDSDKEFQHLINMQVQFAIAESQLILYVVSEKEPLSENDFLIVKQLKKEKKPVILVINKAENSINNHVYNSDWRKLGLGEGVYVSAEHGLNIFLLFEKIFQYIKENELSKPLSSITFCVIGKPNVGKSSLVNTFLHEDKMMVSDTAGTTRDAIDNQFSFNNKLYTIIDTAGLRQRGKLDEIEKFALLRSKMAIKRSFIVLLMVDGSQPISDQDKNVAQLVYDSNMPCIILVNKIDLIEKNNQKLKELELSVRDAFKFLPYAPIVFISIKNDNVQLNKILGLMDSINDEMQRKVPPRILKEVIDKATVINPPPQFKGQRVEFRDVKQVEGRMPTFVINVNNVKYLHFSYMRFIENQLRVSFNFKFIPILVYYRDSKANAKD